MLSSVFKVMPRCRLYIYNSYVMADTQKTGFAPGLKLFHYKASKYVEMLISVC